LSRAVCVHRAPLLFVKEDAILVLLLDEADDPASHATRVALPKLGLRERETTSQRRNLFIADAHGAGKSATAATAPQTLKAQTVFVPEIIHHKMTYPAHIAEDVIRSTATAPYNMRYSI
jgi:hypothetical protein